MLLDPNEPCQITVLTASQGADLPLIPPGILPDADRSMAYDMVSKPVEI